MSHYLNAPLARYGILVVPTRAKAVYLVPEDGGPGVSLSVSTSMRGMMRWRLAVWVYDFPTLEEISNQRFWVSQALACYSSLAGLYG